MLESRELSGASRALHWARVDGVELKLGESWLQRGGALLSLGGQWKVGGSGVATASTPLSLAVASEIDLRQAGLPIISGRPERSERLALSITAPARTRCPGRTQTRPTAPWPPCCFNASFTAESTRFAAWAV